MCNLSSSSSSSSSSIDATRTTTVTTTTTTATTTSAKISVTDALISVGSSRVYEINVLINQHDSIGEAYIASGAATWWTGQKILQQQMLKLYSEKYA